MRYNLINNITGQPTEGITIHETAKEDFMDLMNWHEDDWNINTKAVEEPREGKFNLSNEMIRDSENVDVLLKGSVKKFIKRVKEKRVGEMIVMSVMELNKLAGDKLV